MSIKNFMHVVLLFEQIILPKNQKTNKYSSNSFTTYYDGPHSSDRIFILLRYDFYSKYPVLKNGK